MRSETIAVLPSIAAGEGWGQAVSWPDPALISQDNTP